MIAIDTSSFSAYLLGEESSDTEAIHGVLKQRQAILPPIVVSELLSNSELTHLVVKLILTFPLLEITEGYWERAGFLRARILEKKYKARLPDTLIAQSCIDHEIPLITRDPDFRHFVQWGGLKIYPSKGESKNGRG